MTGEKSRQNAYIHEQLRYVRLLKNLNDEKEDTYWQAVKAVTR